MTAGKSGLKVRDIGRVLSDNIVTVIFVVFILVGMLVSEGVTLEFFMNDLLSRIFRNLFLVLSLIVPVIAGLGLNFGIVVGAMAGQIAIVILRYFNFGGVSGLLLCFLISLPIAILFGFLTGSLYNKTRGQEMIVSLIVGFFADGLYQFLFLFVVGVIIPVSITNPLIKPDGVGIRMTVDLGAHDQGGVQYALDRILQIPFLWALIALAAGVLIVAIVRRFIAKRKGRPFNNKSFIINCAICGALIIFGVVCIISKNAFNNINQIPVVTSLLIIALCVFTQLILKTKLGQDFRSVGQSQHISEISGINVDRRRIIATIISTVLAAWGMIIYVQNMGTLNTYGAHKQIGMFSVAALLVGGASTSKATIRHAIIGTILFNAMFIMSPEIGKAVFGQALLGEYFRTFMVYGVICIALSLYVWKTIKKKRVNV